jgi:DNA-binding NtrC family response regulator
MSTAKRVLAIDDEPDASTWLKVLLESRGYTVRIAGSGRQAEEQFRSWQPSLVLLDMVLPDSDGLSLLGKFREADPEVQVILVTGHGSVAKAVEAMQLGAFSFLEKPLVPEHLTAVLDRASERAGLAAENRRLREELDAHRVFPKIVARSDKMEQLFKLMKVVAPTDASVLIQGENGTGKELVAAAIHEHSKQARGPFIRLNCAAIPSELLESELFGHRKGAFTGAIADKVGLVELAEGGSLLLDEIGEMAPQLQVKLLRVLQEREFRPVGSTRVVRPNFRLICATNANLDTALGNGKLRQDLYFRINTITLAIPPLRERPDDIMLLAEHFRSRMGEKHQRDVQAIDPEARRLLVRYPWPGNVRELEHVIERAIIVCQAQSLTVTDLPPSLREPSAPAVTSKFVIPPHHTLADLERLAIIQTLERTRWNKRATASALGVYRPTLYSKLRKYNIIDEGPRRKFEEPEAPASSGGGEPWPSGTSTQ